MVLKIDGWTIPEKGMGMNDGLGWVNKKFTTWEKKGGHPGCGAVAKVA
jgi:hypothetical protein